MAENSELKEKIKTILTKMGIEIKVKKEEPVIKLEDVTLNDGSMLSVDALEVNSAATYTGADGVAVPAEGDYTTEDGTVITCVAGVVTNIVPPSSEDSSIDASKDDLKARLENIEKYIETLKSNNTKLEANFSKSEKELKETKNSLFVALQAIDVINENAVNLSLEAEKTTKVSFSEIPYDKMSNKEKVLFNRGKI
jgi:hypothetical protein